MWYFALIVVGISVSCGGADVEAVLRRLSLSQKIGQMTLVCSVSFLVGRDRILTEACSRSQTENIGKANELYSRGFGQGAVTP
jgi:hypothetical protein